MDIESLRAYCLKKPFTEECFPFGESVIVFKVGGKMFLLADIYEKPLAFNVKCDPEKAIQLRESHDYVKPGYHMSKTHWNTVTCEGRASHTFIKEQIDHSYEIVWNSLPKKVKAGLLA